MEVLTKKSSRSKGKLPHVPGPSNQPNNQKASTHNPPPFRAHIYTQQSRNHRLDHTVPPPQHKRPFSRLAAATDIGVIEAADAHAALVARAGLAFTAGAADASLEGHFVVERAVEGELQRRGGLVRL